MLIVELVIFDDNWLICLGSTQDLLNKELLDCVEMMMVLRSKTVVKMEKCSYNNNNFVLIPILILFSMHSFSMQIEWNNFSSKNSWDTKQAFVINRKLMSKVGVVFVAKCNFWDEMIIWVWRTFLQKHWCFVAKREFLGRCQRASADNLKHFLFLNQPFWRLW